MEPEVLERPAQLKLWCSVAAKWLLVLPDRFDTVHEAIAAASKALSIPSNQPWIVTEDGEILSPNWVRVHLNQ